MSRIGGWSPKRPQVSVKTFYLFVFLQIKVFLFKIWCFKFWQMSDGNTASDVYLVFASASVNTGFEVLHEVITGWLKADHQWKSQHLHTFYEISYNAENMNQSHVVLLMNTISFHLTIFIHIFGYAYKKGLMETPSCT